MGTVAKRIGKDDFDLDGFEEEYKVFLDSNELVKLPRSPGRKAGIMTG
jgi:hypothetical protein